MLMENCLPRIFSFRFLVLWKLRICGGDKENTQQNKNLINVFKQHNKFRSLIFKFLSKKPPSIENSKHHLTSQQKINKNISFIWTPSLKHVKKSNHVKRKETSPDKGS